MKKALAWGVASALVLAVLVVVLDRLTPWPQALLIRYAFEKGGAAMAQALEKHVPPGVAEVRDIAYRDDDRDARLDVFYPERIAGTDTVLPTIVWVHGGAWISGSKEDVANYLRILAAHGYTAVGIDYSIAPGKRYPLPVIQANDALKYLAANAERLHVDRNRFVLAGDSAGSQIAAQVAALTTSPAYARTMRLTPALEAHQLKATVLACGAYDLALVDYDGAFGGFLKTVLWAYTGRKDFLDDPDLASASVADHVTADFPPTFLTAGNADPLQPQSRDFASRLTHADVAVDTLFYPADHTPALAHEYQFDLDGTDGRQALARILAFLQANTR
ncbi:alpha/beta hydrolase [Luteimonas suaedae]|uniref:alpha/beta hydrolase n=1 Tax=Luteimonas suaedae TaxID=2605430 RepID=UPI0011EC1C6F|nr:alpha/beta hydrolase [Luteimonas suaedae]